MTTEKIAMHWINGEWVDSNPHRESIDPATYQVIGTYANGGVEVAAAAIAAARCAFETTRWKRDASLRARVLEELAASFERHTDSLVEQLALENGKVRPEASFEVNSVPSKLRYYAALARVERGHSGTPRPDVLSIVLREPMGVAGIIVPWNSPVLVMIRSLAPALAAGATVVIKMPGQTAQTNALTAKVMSEAPSLPRGVMNLFSELGAEGSKHLVASPAVPVISFTGSSATGRAISAVGAQYLKRFGLELGGKTPHLVFDDANIDAALPVLEKSLTVFAGQFCMTGSRLLVQRSAANQVRKKLANRFLDLKVGPASDPRSEMSSMIDKANVARVDHVVNEAISQGARIVVRGGPIVEGELARGAFYRPTLLEVDNPHLDIVQKETFGPVLTMQVFDTEAEAISLANDSEYGLSAGIWTRDLQRSFRVARELQSGTVWINDWAKVYDEFEEGGYRQSGLGRLNGVAAIEDFIEYKHITLSTADAHTQEREGNQ